MAEHAEDADPRPAAPAHLEPAHPERSRRGGRRVRTAAPDGSDPVPQPEPPRHAPTENDERLFGDKPPHY